MEMSPEDVLFVTLSRSHLVHLTTPLPSQEVRLEKREIRTTPKPWLQNTFTLMSCPKYSMSALGDSPGSSLLGCWQGQSES